MFKKLCTCCERKRLIKFFSFKNKLKLVYNSWCKNCQKIYKNLHYKRNKKYYIEKAYKWKTERKKENIQKILTYFKAHPCVDCGEDDPLVLEFDHFRDKKYEVADLLNRRGTKWKIIHEEITKCKVRCANCHRRKTLKQQNALRYRLL
jgi:hypothetical protein